jgi:hypothetical protein
MLTDDPQVIALSERFLSLMVATEKSESPAHP